MRAVQSVHAYGRVLLWMRMSSQCSRRWTCCWDIYRIDMPPISRVLCVCEYPLHASACTSSRTRSHRTRTASQTCAPYDDVLLCSRCWIADRSVACIECWCPCKFCLTLSHSLCTQTVVRRCAIECSLSNGAIWQMHGDSDRIDEHSAPSCAFCGCAHPCTLLCKVLLAFVNIARVRLSKWMNDAVSNEVRFGIESLLAQITREYRSVVDSLVRNSTVLTFVWLFGFRTIKRGYSFFVRELSRQSNVVCLQKLEHFNCQTQVASVLYKHQSNSVAQQSKNICKMIHALPKHWRVCLKCITVSWSWVCGRCFMGW
jgi:hypothetical protein